MTKMIVFPVPQREPEHESCEALVASLSLEVPDDGKMFVAFKNADGLSFRTANLSVAELNLIIDMAKKTILEGGLSK